MDVREIAIEVEGGNLCGRYHEPLDAGRGAAPAPAVLIVPGFADTAVGAHNMHVQLARALAGQGFAVMRFDYRGMGESGGCFRAFTARSGLADAAAALRALREQPSADASRIGLVGFSLGGAIAAELAASPSLGVRAVALWAPVAYMRETFDGFFSAEHKRQAEERGWMDWNGWEVGAAFLNTVSELSPLDALRQSKADALVIHGTADAEVPTANGIAYRELGAELQLVEDGDHLFSSSERKRLATAWTADWLAAKLLNQSDKGGYLP